MASPEIDIPELTPEQRKAVAAQYLTDLAADKPEILPPEIFTPLASLMVMNTAEVALVKKPPRGGEVPSIYLAQRPSSDRFWPNQWHITGSVVRAQDPIRHEHDYDAAVNRAVSEAGGGMELITQPTEYDNVRRRGIRGSETTVRLLAEAQGTPDNGYFFPIADVLQHPPEGGLIDTHAAAIEKVAATYRSLRTD